MSTISPKTSTEAREGESVVETTMKSYTHHQHHPTPASARLRVSFAGASNCYAIKREDKHAVVLDFQYLERCQEDSNLQLLGYAGVFDGHDGEAASQYCRDGLLPHILAETMTLQRKKTTSESDLVDTQVMLKAGYTSAFERAQERFSAGRPAPQLADVSKGKFSSTRIGLFWRFVAGVLPRQGGTTALVTSLYLEGGSPFLFVANTGDCRLLIDDGTGTNSFRQITEEHRPTLAYESARLRRAELRGECRLKHSQDANSSLRIYPGGLAVSRTIGDCLHSKAVICTPEVYKVDLDEDTTYRIVLASDGLWDVLSNDRVAQFAARRQLDEGTQVEEEISAEEATNRIMEECLTHGGYVDDVTVIALDITIKKRGHHT